MKKLLLLLGIIVVSSLSMQAQIGIPSTATDASAELKVYSVSNNTGVMIPNLTTSQMQSITSPATGLMIFDTDDNVLKFYDGTNWLYLASFKQYTTGTLPVAPNIATGQIVYNTTTNQLNVLKAGVWKPFTLTGTTLP